ncbi:MAG: two-component regulator propeller domain-containing protein [Flavobacteriales bacterium]|nr:two-component regulator propeller domain-containing protein [Flavobacteriales bacterium]
MKRIVLSLVILAHFVPTKGQNVPTYSWQEHLSFQNAKCIVEVENNIYCATENGLFYYNKDDYTINRLNKINGLSDIGISSLAYDKENKMVVIAYNNTNIDLMKDEGIVNIPDIKLKEITGNKEINNITINNDIAYLSCSFGLVLIDLEKEEIKDTYKIGEGGNFVSINDCYIDDTCVFVGTSDGAYFADKNSNSLFDFNSWTKHPSYPSEVSEIIVNSWGILFNNQYPYVKVRNSNEYYLEIGNVNISIYQNGNIISELIADSNFTNIQDAWVDKENILWIADSANSLVKYENFLYHSTVKPNGPASNSIHKINILNDNLTLLHNQEKNSISESSDMIEWTANNYNTNVISSVKIGNQTFYGSSSNSLIGVENNVVTNYSLQNTNNVVDSNGNIVSLLTDKDNNLWGTKSYSASPLFCKTNQDEWIAFNMPFVANQSTEIGEVIIDDYGQKWGIRTSNGLFVYNDNNTIWDKADDQFAKITTGLGIGNLPNNNVYCLANDLEGNIWVGTKEGVCVFYSPSSVFSGYNFDAQQIIVEENGFGQYLLNAEIVYTIAIDGGNRKWIGTLGSGLFLLSEDGTEEIFHFTDENSPLLSNTILDIEINHETAEVFIATDKGLMSFRSDATQSSQHPVDLHIFPNPVRESYNGIITINGLSYESNVKITDVSGNLVFETNSEGGTAIWNGSDINNNRVGTGVYLVLSSDKYGREKTIGKILFIH